MLRYITNYKFYSGLTRGDAGTIRAFYFICLFLLSFTLPSYSQKDISGIVNKYYAVESIIGTQAVKVTSSDNLQPGDTVLLIQMKGMGILTRDDDYGKQQNLNHSGNYEFLLIDEITGDNVVSFTREFMKEYDSDQTAQLVKVSGYESATVTGTLTAEPWDGEKGGILALIVTNTLTLEADIDVSGKGFRGGAPVSLSSDACSVVDDNSYPLGFDKAGRKGEGPVTYFLDELEIESPIGNDFVHGKGRIATGGGGGNGIFSGGGGGASYGHGSYGGGESVTCFDPGNDTEGVGGLATQLVGTGGEFINRFFLGGAGGGSTQFGERTASHGGNGGGLVIIIANNIVGTPGYGIFADGNSADLATAGAGGGGGGGIIVTSIDNYSGIVNLSVSGGKGGNVNHELIAGPGGGGGGGAVIHSGNALPALVTTHVEPGAGGMNIIQNEPHGSAIGSPGGVVEDLEISLNGLLFNGIKTELPLICEETAPGLFEGTNPRGGIQPYLYEWFKSTDGATWNIIAGADEKDYQSGQLSETTRFFRRVKDDDSDPVIDTSNVIIIEVQPKIYGNTIADAQTICEGETPLTLTGLTPWQGGTGIFEYEWIESSTPGQWIIPDGVSDELDYSPSNLFTTTSYFRIATSGVCADSSNIVGITVHPAIQNNTLEDDQTICYGDTPLPVMSPGHITISGGTGTYNYSWESGDEGSWEPVDGSGNTAAYAPGTLNETIQIRRIVESGACNDTSQPQTITVLPLITGNTVSGGQIICYLDSPELFSGQEPVGGDGTYSYIWQTAGISMSWAASDSPHETRNYQSPAITEPAYFRRIVLSGHGNACKDTSSHFFVDLHPFSYGEIDETSDTVCVGEFSELSFNLSGEGFPWNLSFTNGADDYSVTGILSGNLKRQIQPFTADSSRFQYSIKSLTDRFGCNAPAQNLTGAAWINVYAYPDPNPGLGGDVCGLEFELNAVPAFGKGHWESVSPNSAFLPNETVFNPRVIVESYGTHEFWWTETNWQCAASEKTFVTFYEKPVNIIAGEDKNLSYIFETSMEAVLPDNMPDVYGIWTIQEGSGNILFPDAPGTMVTGMAFGDNVFKWTVYNGACEPVSELVTITVWDLISPTGFSPNNSGMNDRFIIQGLENSFENELTIFNRQGNVVFKTVNYRNDWEGKNQSGQPLPQDTYYYILNVDNRYSYKGFIVLRR